ncbi:MAG TPA: putative toxin-antitoxin system toxin component, PIN family [Chitinophagales bacterium]|nr:putative toxin-antitoxin system toxin component, PIN family [Chitinophagales bacterium]HNM31545.1 putative toxin-antitoxin system toxin component, PIN family [Chitinophagales bacterium]
MQVQKDSIIIDTNLWISFLLTKDFSKLDSILANNSVKLIFSSELLEEFITVTQRRKFKKYFDMDDVQKLILLISDKAIFVKVTSLVNSCRDEKDNFLLALAKDSKATHLITGDKDLLVLKKYKFTQIVTIGEYLTDK